MKRLVHNWKLKLIAVFASIILWFFVVGIENSVYLIPEPMTVRTENLGKNVSPASPIPDVRIFVNARGGESKSIKKSDYSAYVDLTGLGAGKHSVPVLVSTQNPQYPVLKADPAFVEVTLAPVGEKEVPLVALVKGTPANGFEVKEVKTDLKTVKVSAANNILEKIESVSAVVELAGDETSDIKQSIVPQTAEGLGIALDGFKTAPDQVTVTAVIIPVAGSKTVKVTPQLEGTYAYAFEDQIVVIPSTVTIRGDDQSLKGITEIKTEPINISTLINRSVPLEVALQMPDRVSQADPGLKTALMLDVSKFGKKTVFADIRITKESPSFKTGTITPTRIAVTISGPPALLDGVGDSDLTVNLDLEGMDKPGKFTIGADAITIPAGVSIVEYEPASVTVAED